MADIDLLVRATDSAEIVSLLQSMGYQETRFAIRDREFSPIKPRIPSELGEHANNDVKIELHERISEALPLRETDITEVVLPKQPRPGLNPYPSTASLMLHLLLHASGSMVSQSLRLIQLHDVAMLSLKMNANDWEGYAGRVVTEIASGGHSPRCTWYLDTTSPLFRLPLSSSRLFNAPPY